MADRSQLVRNCLDFSLAATIPPAVDFTPGPIPIELHVSPRSAFFTDWDNDLLVGSLRARTLFRVRIKDDQPVEREKLLEHLGRIRDVEMGPKGSVLPAYRTSRWRQFTAVDTNSSAE